MSAESGAGLEVVRSVSVPLSQAHTFELFITRMTDFWPKEYSIGNSEIAEVVVEACSGGRWFERGVDGTEYVWGHVASWDPPREVVLLWQIGAHWQFDPDFRTEVEVSFTPEESGRTRLDLRHRNLQRYGDNAEQMRAIFDDPSGWTGVLARFVDLSSADCPTDSGEPGTTS